MPNLQMPIEILPKRTPEDMPMMWHVTRVKNACARIEKLIMADASPAAIAEEVVIIETFLPIAKRKFTEGKLE